MILRVLALILIAALAAPVHAGPFGVDVDKFTPEAYGCERDADPSSHLYTCKSFPKPHPDVGLYKAMYFDGIGLCAIHGFGTTEPTSSTGASLRSRVDSISEQLASKYGPGTKIDTLQNGSLWTEEQYWMMGLSKQDRKYAYFWKGISPPVDGIVNIVLASFANTLESGSFLVSFYTLNTSACDAAKKKSDASSF